MHYTGYKHCATVHKISNINLNMPIRLAIECRVYITLLLYKNTAGAIHRADATTRGATSNILNKFIIL